MVIAF